MEITYKNKKLRRICTENKVAIQTYGIEMARKIEMRIQEIQVADSVESMIRYRIGRCHLLKNNRKDQYAVDLIHPYRLVFEQQGDTIELVHIFEIVDYH